MSPRKTAASAAALAKFEERFTKSYGDGTLVRGGKKTRYEVIPTGVLALDAATVVGGYVEGRITLIWGVGDAGKSSLALMGIAQAQKKHPDKVCAYIDIENKYDESWAEALGVDRSRMYLYRPLTAEDASDALKDFITSGLCSMVVVDSVGAMLGQKEQEKDAGEATIAVVAKIVTRMVKFATLFAPQHNTAVLILNQVRDQISASQAQIFPGGWALRHGSTMQIKLRASTAPSDIKKVRIHGEDVPVAHKIVARMERNKVAPPGDVASWVFVNRESDRFGPVGVDTADEAVSMGETYGAIVRSGAYYTLVSTGERVQGREAMVEVLRSAPDEVSAIRGAALEVLSKKLVDEEEPISLPDEIPAEVPEQAESPTVTPDAPQAAPEAVVTPTGGEYFASTPVAGEEITYDEG